MRKHRSTPVARALQARVTLLATTLRPATIAGYRSTVKRFVRFLDENFPAVEQPADLRRDPHMLGWLEHLWKTRAHGSGAPLRNETRAHQLLQLRRLLELLSDHKRPPRPALLRSDDIPRPDQCLPRPLTPEHDAALQAVLRERADLLSSALLLTRLSGMRIGECLDLSPDCLRHLGGEQWALHVPLGKLHSERWVPADEEIRALVSRLLFLRTLPPRVTDAFLLPRPKGRAVLGNALRAALGERARQAGIETHIVPHQLRHTYATSMLRAGVSLPALMKLLGHRTANMTLRYVQITQEDLQREFRLARQNPRHRMPVPAALDEAEPTCPDAPFLLERLSGAVRLLQLFQQHNPTLDPRGLELLARRLRRVHSLFRKLTQVREVEK